MRALMWFRSDLRVADNTALQLACREADEGIVGVFVVCPKQWAAHDWGRPKVEFVLRNVQELSRSLAGLGVPLLILRCPTFSELPPKLLRLAIGTKCQALFFNDEYEVNERRRDAEVARLFESNNLSVRGVADQLILDHGNIRTGTGGVYTVFTPFRRKWLAEFDKGAQRNIHAKPKRQRAVDILADAVPKTLRGFPGPSCPNRFPAGEAAAHKRLAEFMATSARSYDKHRDLPATDATSCLSPYLATGVLSPRQCLHAAMDANRGRVDAGNTGVTTWITQLIWREFYRHILIGFPRVCMGRPFKLSTEALAWHDDDEAFQAWCKGETGVPIVDAGMRQLLETGWMHNRVRMITAMFLTKDLLIDWRWGERFFMQHLVDGDFANNNGGWQWSASTGTDAAPYFRIFNPFTQGKRFDPAGDYVRRYVPELAGLSSKQIHAPHVSSSGPTSYPRPIVDHDAARKRAIDAFKRLASGGPL